MADVEISYKGSTIASTSSSGTITLDTAGTYCEDDIEVVYTKPGGSINLQSKTVTPSGATQTITADSGYDGLDEVTVNPIVLKSGVLLPAAELIQTYSYNKLFVTDEKGTIPSYTTTATSILAAQTLSPTVQLDLANYDYELLIRGLAIPIYNTATKEKGRTVYTTFAGGYEIINIPANTFYDGSTYYNKNYVAAQGLASTVRNCYWSSATAISPTSSGYGVYFSQAAPTFSSATVTNPTLTVKSPAFYIRGSTSVFTSSAWSKMTDIRFQYKIELYRIPKSTYNLDGWGFEQQTHKIINDYYNNNATLT